MRRFTSFACVLLLGVAAVAFSLVEFTVTPGDGRITIRWETADETGLARYVLERSVDQGPFAAVASIAPRGGQQTYQYIDTDIYAFDRTPRTFAYRLKFVHNNGTATYSVIRETTIQISSIRRTWGSIKAMFR